MVRWAWYARVAAPKLTPDWRGTSSCSLRLWVERAENHRERIAMLDFEPQMVLEGTSRPADRDAAELVEEIAISCGASVWCDAAPRFPNGAMNFPEADRVFWWVRALRERTRQ